jgi:tetratricopeptide (TPR) repeat protein
LDGPEYEHGSREEQQKWLSRLKSPVSALRGQSCPDDEVWLLIAAGVPTSEDTGALLAHAAECDYCGHSLLQAAEHLSAVPHEEEEVAIDRIGLDRARQIYAAEAGTIPARKPPARPVSSRIWAYAAAAIIAIAPITWWATTKSHSDDPSTLLAAAYSQHRTLELRFPGAKHAPLQQTRGSVSATDQPAARTQALLIIQQQLSADPDQANSLAAKGRLALLDWNYKEAIASFTRAMELQPESQPLLVDLGSAYFERASVENSVLDYGRAFEYIERALARNNNDPIALFNRAVIAEQMQTYQQAIDSWQKFLQVEPAGDWSAEARQRLQALEQKKKLRN